MFLVWSKFSSCFSNSKNFRILLKFQKFYNQNLKKETKSSKNDRNHLIYNKIYSHYNNPSIPHQKSTSLSTLTSAKTEHFRHLSLFNASKIVYPRILLPAGCCVSVSPLATFEFGIRRTSGPQVLRFVWSKIWSRSMCT